MLRTTKWKARRAPPAQCLWYQMHHTKVEATSAAVHLSCKELCKNLPRQFALSSAVSPPPRHQMQSHKIKELTKQRRLRRRRPRWKQTALRRQKQNLVQMPKIRKVKVPVRQM